MTDTASEALARLRALNEARTKGPLYVADWGYDDGYNLVTIEARRPETVSEGEPHIWPGGVQKLKVASTEDGDNPLADAAAIVAAMNALGPLLDAAEALRHLVKAYVSLLEAAHERITELGGSCDDVAVMELSDPRLAKARAALDAIAKLGERND